MAIQWPKHFFLPLLTIFIVYRTTVFLPFFQTETREIEYIRPPPRPLVDTLHHGSESDPQQVHISLAGKEYMRVTWVTDDKDVPSVVEYGKISGEYDAIAEGGHTSYVFSSYTSGNIHHVKVGPLEPSTTYYYRCGGHGPELSFKTPPSTFPVEFVVVGDPGQTEDTVSTLAHVGDRDYDVFLLPGDLSYADENQSRWDSFGRLVEEYASRRPWMVTEGNHERECCAFTAYNARWLMPYKESGSTSNLYYSFDVAGCHIIMLGSYTDFKKGSDQYKWVEADLGKVDRTATPWVFAIMHVPWYNTNEAHRDEGESMRQAMEDLMYKVRVDVVFAGHVHAYERFTRIYNKKHDPCGPVYVTIGDGGNRQGLAHKFVEPAPLSLYREPSFGHGRLSVVNKSHARWSWHRNDVSGSFVADEVWVQSLTTTGSCWPSTVDEDEPKDNNIDEQ